MRMENRRPGRDAPEAIVFGAALAAAPVAAQLLDPAPDAKAVSVTGGGRDLVRNGDLAREACP